MDVDPYAPLRKIKETWYDWTGQPPDVQRLEFKGEVLDDNHWPFFCKIQNQDTLKLSISSTPTRPSYNGGYGHMDGLELDHFSRLFDKVFDLFHQSCQPNSDVVLRL